MTVRIPALLNPPIGFAHRGARADAEQENTIAAFELALELGATGLESDVWVTADGEAVLDHDGMVGRRPRRRPVKALRRDQLPAHVPTLADLYAACGTDVPLSLDVRDVDAFDPVVATARAAGGAASENLWLCHHDWETLAGWRTEAPAVHLVDSTRLHRMKHGPERRAAALAKVGIDAVNLHHSDWTGGLTTLFHRFGVVALGWDAQQPRVLDELLDLGIDGVYSDHVGRMTAALARAYPMTR